MSQYDSKGVSCDDESFVLLQKDAVDVNLLEKCETKKQEAEDRVGSEDDLDELCSTTQLKKVLRKRNLLKLTLRYRIFHGSFLHPDRRLVWQNIILAVQHFQDANKSGFELCDEDKPPWFTSYLDLYRQFRNESYNEDSPENIRPVASEVPSLICSEHISPYSYCLSQQGIESVIRIISCFAHHHPELSFLPEIYPITVLLRHYLDEANTFGLLSTLVDSKEPKYFVQGNEDRRVEWVAVKMLCIFYHKNWYSKLVSCLSETVVNHIFQNWFWIVFSLPETYLLRVMDCYLCEGQKVLYRVFIILFKQFMKFFITSDVVSSSELGSFKASSESTMDYIMCDESSSISVSQQIFHLFRDFVYKEKTAPHLLLEKGFKIRGLSRSKIESFASQAKEVGGAAAAQNCGPPKNGSVIQHHQGQHGAIIGSSLSSVAHNSEIVRPEQLKIIWSWLPPRISSLEEAKLVFSTNIHGTSLSTFYSKCEQYEPTILIIKTTDKEILGAYCSTSWVERNKSDERGCRQKYFGTGESFLFKIDSVDGGVFKYGWTPPEAKNDGEEEKPLDSSEKHARQLFMCAQDDCFSIGGGNGNGIYVNSNLCDGRSEPTLTFKNPSLTSNPTFQISNLEVIGFNFLDL